MSRRFISRVEFHSLHDSSAKAAEAAHSGAPNARLEQCAEGGRSRQRARRQRIGGDERERRRAARRLKRQLLHKRAALLLCGARDSPAVAARGLQANTNNTTLVGCNRSAATSCVLELMSLPYPQRVHCTHNKETAGTFDLIHK